MAASNSPPHTRLPPDCFHIDVDHDADDHDHQDADDDDDDDETEVGIGSHTQHAPQHDVDNSVDDVGDHDDDRINALLVKTVNGV